VHNFLRPEALVLKTLPLAHFRLSFSTVPLFQLNIPVRFYVHNCISPLLHNQSGGSKTPAVLALKRLRASIRLEMRLFYTVPVVGLLYPFVGDATFRIIAAVVWSSYIILHLLLSYTVTMVFLRPLVSTYFMLSGLRLCGILLAFELRSLVRTANH
jgi:hypothetical protein